MQVSNQYAINTLCKKNGLKEFGVGVDIESIKRFYAIHKSFLRKVFTKDELEYCYSKSNPAPHLAVRYAGKEAVVKALYELKRENIKRAIDYQHIEICNDDKGVPTVYISERNFSDITVHISLSHSHDCALAFAVASKKKGGSPFIDF